MTKLKIILLILTLISVFTAGAIVQFITQPKYEEGRKEGYKEGYRISHMDYEREREVGYEQGHQKGYREAGQDALRLVECYKTEEPTIENCLRVFLLEDYRILPHLNPNQKESTNRSCDSCAYYSEPINADCVLISSDTKHNELYKCYD